MKKQIKVYEDGNAYIGRELANDYKGDADAFVDAACVVVRNPKVSLDNLLQSLDIIKKDIRLRIEMGEK